MLLLSLVSWKMEKQLIKVRFFTKVALLIFQNNLTLKSFLTYLYFSKTNEQPPSG